MADDSPRADALVVGAGLAGAAFALAAARRGRSVVVLEAADQVDHLPYPELLWGATMRRLDALGVGDRVRERSGIRLRGVDVRHAHPGARMAIDERDLSRADAEAWCTDAGATRRLLLDAAQETGLVDVRLETRATGLLHEDGRAVGVTARDAEGERKWRADLVVGADGGRSRVRAWLGLAADAERFPLDFLVRFVPRPSDLAPGHARAVLDSHGFRGEVVAAALIPVREEEVGLVLFARNGAHGRLGMAADPDAALRDAALRVVPSSLHGTLRHSAFQEATRHVGHAAGYGAPGAALVGDAAHPVSPIGGQGANMAVADACAVARCAFPTTGERPAWPRVLEAYEARRRQANASGLAISRYASLILGATWRAPALARPMPLALALMHRAPRLKTMLVHHEAHAYEAE